jgi:hypothetical protein
MRVNRVFSKRNNHERIPFIPGDENMLRVLRKTATSKTLYAERTQEVVCFQ